MLYQSKNTERGKAQTRNVNGRIKWQIKALGASTHDTGKCASVIVFGRWCCWEGGGGGGSDGASKASAYAFGTVGLFDRRCRVTCDAHGSTAAAAAPLCACCSCCLLEVEPIVLGRLCRNQAPDVLQGASASASRDKGRCKISSSWRALSTCEELTSSAGALPVANVARFSARLSVGS